MQLSQDTRLEKSSLKCFRPRTHPYCKLLLEKLFQFIHVKTLLPEHFILLGIVVFNPKDKILNYISAKINSQWPSIINSRLAQW